MIFFFFIPSSALRHKYQMLHLWHALEIRQSYQLTDLPVHPCHMLTRSVPSWLKKHKSNATRGVRWSCSPGLRMEDITSCQDYDALLGKCLIFVCVNNIWLDLTCCTVKNCLQRWTSSIFRLKKWTVSISSCIFRVNIDAPQRRSNYFTNQ